MITVVPLQAQHVVDILYRGVLDNKMRITNDGPVDTIRTLAQEYEQEGMSFTALLGSVPLFCVLIHLLSPGVADLGLLVSVDFVQHKISACHAALDTLESIFVQHHLHRIQTTVRCAFAEGIRFAEWAGFEREGLARQNTWDRKDSWYYGKVR